MKTVVCPADDTACGHYRLIWPAEAAHAQGHDVTIDRDCREWRMLYEDVDGHTHLRDALDPDPAVEVVVFQRVLHRRRVEVIQALQRRGVAVVIDVDDDFHRIHDRNVAKQAIETTDPDIHPRWLEAACHVADLVTVTTPSLARRYAPHGRVALIPNYVPKAYLRWPATRRARLTHWRPGLKVLVGWSGSLDTHPGDLESTGGAVGKVMREERDRAHFGVIGTGKGVTAALDLDVTQHSGWVPLEKYPKYLADLDVGLVPLAANAFNRGKSWLKGVEMAACGVPFVASPTPAYERLALLGAGRLAGSPREWARELRRLVVDDTWRAECAARGTAVAETLTIEGNVDDWLDAWSRARTHRRHVAAA